MPAAKHAARDRRKQRHANRMRSVIRRDIGAQMQRDNQRLAATWKLVHEHRAANPDDQRDFDTIAAELAAQINAETVNVQQLRRSWRAE